MQRFGPDPINEIKARLGIVEVLSPHVALKKAGRTYKGLCPFHNEKSPSFTVFPDRGSYHCFGCSANGDIFTFVMKTRNVEFSDALRMLADQAGVTLPEHRASPEQEEAHRRLYEIAASASLWFHHQLLNSRQAEAARQYLERRGLIAATIEAFQLGYAPDEWHALEQHLSGRGFTSAEIIAGGLAIERDGGGHYDRFRGRIIYPIHDLKGNPVGFGGRVLDDSQPKYLNSPETPIFTKGGNLYAVDVARSSIRETDLAVVVEGYMDVLAAHQRGYRNVVASLGTAITESQIHTLKRFTKNITLALDADAAGAEATLRGLEVARESMVRVSVPVPTWRGYIQYEQRLDANLRIATLPPGKDPDDVIRQDAAEWASIIVHAAPVVDYYLDAVIAKADLTTAPGIAAAVTRVAPVLAEVADPTARAVYTQRLADRLKIDGRRLTERVAQERARLSGRNRPSPRPSEPAPGRADESSPSPDGAPAEAPSQATVKAPIDRRRSRSQTLLTSPAERMEAYLVKLAIGYPEARSLLSESLSLDDISDATRREIIGLCLSWQGSWSLDTFVDALDAALLPVVVELADQLNRGPRLAPSGLEREVRKAVQELRRSNLRRSLEYLHNLRRDAEEAGDTEALLGYSAQTNELLGLLGPLETQGRPIALVWRR